MKRLDIVYILKEDTDPAELIYSLRSVEANFPHRKVWFVCGQPEGLTPDGRILHVQRGDSKWERVKSSLYAILKAPGITEDFYLFNDDFFVMQPVRGEFINFSNGTMEKRIRDIEKKNLRVSKYSRELLKAKITLSKRGCDTISFAVHMPILLNKHLIRKTLDEFKGEVMFRSIYGNFNHIPYIFHEDVKIYENHIIPDEDCDFLSSTEFSFRDGEVGKFIRERFPNPSRFEKQKTVDVHEHFTEEGDMI